MKKLTIVPLKQHVFKSIFIALTNENKDVIQNYDEMDGDGD